jgi:hypothetical protein
MTTATPPVGDPGRHITSDGGTVLVIMKQELLRSNPPRRSILRLELSQGPKVGEVVVAEGLIRPL